MAQLKTKEARPTTKPAEQTEHSATSELKKKGEDLKAELDGLLDDVLEENAEEFVASYVQRGGE
jgi:prokaryotic ubiquitin-like protein Pup